MALRRASNDQLNAYNNTLNDDLSQALEDRTALVEALEREAEALRALNAIKLAFLMKTFGIDEYKLEKIKASCLLDEKNSKRMEENSKRMEHLTETKHQIVFRNLCLMKSNPVVYFKPILDLHGIADTRAEEKARQEMILSFGFTDAFDTQEVKINEDNRNKLKEIVETYNKSKGIKAECNDPIRTAQGILRQYWYIQPKGVEKKGKKSKYILERCGAANTWAEFGLEFSENNLVEYSQFCKELSILIYIDIDIYYRDLNLAFLKA